MTPAKRKEVRLRRLRLLSQLDREGKVRIREKAREKFPTVRFFRELFVEAVRNGVWSKL
jgi:hypothetical protein